MTQWLVVVQEPPSLYLVGVYGPFADRDAAMAAARQHETAHVTCLAVPTLPVSDLGAW